MNKNCEVIQDLLPLYCDKICSENSTTMVEEHLNECGKCTAMLKKLQNGSAVNMLQNESEEIISHHNKSIKRKSLIIGLTMSTFLAVPILVTFIVNLAVGKTLDWFFVVLASLTVFSSITFVPFMVEKKKAFWTIIAFTGSVLMLLLTICIFTGGNWFFMVAVPFLLGMSVLFAPLILIELTNISNFLKGKIALISMLIDTIFLYAVIITSGIYANASFDWVLALLITSYSVLGVWIIFLLFRYAKLHLCTKAGLTHIIIGLFVAFSNDIIRWLSHEALTIEMLRANLLIWKPYTLDANIKVIVLVLLTIIGIVLIVQGQLLQKRERQQ